MKIAYSGVMGGINGFTDAMRGVCDEMIDIPMSDVNNGLHGLKTVDLVFLQPQSEGIAAETLIYLKNIGAFVIQWTGDSRNNCPTYCFDYAQHLNLSCFSNMKDVRFMQEMGYEASFLQIGADPDIYYPDIEVTKDIDIVFMANRYGHFPLSGMRDEMVKELKRTYGSRFKVYGIGQEDGNLMGNQKGEADIYRRAKIGINLSHYDYERYTSDRLFRILLSGTLVLSHEYKGIYEDFNPHDMGIWRNFDELKSHIDYYLANEDARVKIANNGFQKALSKHTFAQMSRDILELYNQHKQN